jgi:hypothetical protein
MAAAFSTVKTIRNFELSVTEFEIETLLTLHSHWELLTDTQ